jgi:hypothetical protein
MTEHKPSGRIHPVAREKVTDLTSYVEKDLTDLQERMIEWLQSEEVGADPAACKNKAEAFALGVKLGVSLRIHFQKSDFNQEARAEAAAAREEAAAAKAAEKPAKKAAKKAAAAAEVEEDEEEEEAPAPAKKAVAKKTAAKKAPAKKASARKAAAEEEGEEEPF